MSCNTRRALRLALAAALGLAAGGAAAQTPEILSRQQAEYDAVAVKSVVELQRFRDTVTVAWPSADHAQARLIALNPKVNSWFLLQLGDADRPDRVSYHIENPRPADQKVELVTGSGAWLILTGPDGAAGWCDLLEGGTDQLEAARATGLPYAPLCDGRLHLRNRVSGSRTNLEATTEFLRDHVWGGESIVTFVKDAFFKDQALETGEELGRSDRQSGAVGPGAAAIREDLDERPVIATRHGMTLTGAEPGRMAVGLWYPISGVPGVFASAYQPKLVSRAILDGPGTANRLGGVEAGANVYLVGFDLSQFDLGFAIGTDHPALGWSTRPPYGVRPAGLPGPDGFKSPAPLIRLGMVSPDLADQTVASFTAGFKRQHGAFKYGDYASLDMGKHYGFIENGVIWSKLQPDLSTLYVLTDGSIGMKTWTEADNVLLPRLLHARQNGVPLVVTDPETGRSVPGDRVTQWGAGNWSGSAEAKLRTLRAGACLKQQGGRSYLIYAYFSSATPSAMARTFQAYDCAYAMLLDMNALEHTYLALYAQNAEGLHIQHLVPGMSAIDKRARDGNVIPRFLGFADNRDFFYLTRKEGAE